MSLRTLPILFLNLGGEMLYILDQRLRAQSIPDEKARKGKLKRVCKHVHSAAINMAPIEDHKTCM